MSKGENKYPSKYRKVVDELIGESFPELNNKNIKAVESGLVSHAFYLPGNFLILNNKKCATLSKRELKGTLVHELCHSVQMAERGFFRSLILFMKYFISSRLKQKIETGADKIAVERGYSEELLASTKRVIDDLKGKTYYGLSPTEIKNYKSKIENDKK